MENNLNKQKYIMGLFLLGYLSSCLLFSIFRFLDTKYNVSLSPPIYMIYIPIIFGFIAQKIALNYLALELKDLIIFEKGLLLHFIMMCITQILNTLFSIYRSTDYLAYNFILNCSPLITYSFFGWIYFYVKEFKEKVRNFLYQPIYIEDEIDNNEENNKIDNNEDSKNNDDEDNNDINPLIKKISDKINDNIKK